jgi:hypothetical protein
MIAHAKGRGTTIRTPGPEGMVAKGRSPDKEPRPGGLLLACQPLAYGCPLPLFALENLCERLGRYFLQSLGQQLDDARLAEGLGLNRIGLTRRWRQPLWRLGGGCGGTRRTSEARDRRSRGGPGG